MPAKLPHGWVKTTLGEVSVPVRTRALPSEAPELPYLGMKHIEAQTMRLLGQGSASLLKSSAVRFKKGDVLYGKMRPYLNKVWLAEFDGLCSEEFLVFPKTDGLHCQLFAYRLNSQDFVEFANHQVSGDRPRVDFKKLATFPYLLQPCGEQERIAAKLGALLSRVVQGETAARRALERLQRYRAAVLRSAVTGELTREWRRTNSSLNSQRESAAQLHKRLLKSRYQRWEEAEFKRLSATGKPPKGNKWKKRYHEPQSPTTNAFPNIPRTWVLASIDQLGWTSGYGTSVKCTTDATGPIVLRIPNIRNRGFDFTDLKFATRSKEIAERNYIAPGDFLLVRTNGSIDLIGRAGLAISALERKCSFASYLIRFRLLGDSTLWSWISLAWDSQIIRTAIQSRAATTAGQYNVSLSGLADLTLPLPPHEEQIEIVRQVDSRLAAADRLASTLNHQLDRARATRQSLLREAFTGKLVTQDPNDEPASVLLGRIRACREVEAKKPKAKRMPKPKSDIARRPLLQVLREHKKPMSPEALFRSSGYATLFSSSDEPQDVVDAFYKELRELTDKPAKVTQAKDSKNQITLSAPA